MNTVVWIVIVVGVTFAVWAFVRLIKHIRMTDEELVSEILKNQKGRKINKDKNGDV